MNTPGQGSGMTAEEVIFSNMTQIEAVIRLLIKKGLITKEEIQQEYTQVMNEAKQENQ